MKTVFANDLYLPLLTLARTPTFHLFCNVVVHNTLILIIIIHFRICNQLNRLKYSSMKETCNGTCTSCQNILRYSGISHLFYFSDRYSNTDLHCVWHTWWSHNITHFACIGSSAVDSQVNTFRCTFLVEEL